MAGRINFNVKARSAIVIENQMAIENIDRISKEYGILSINLSKFKYKIYFFPCASTIVSADNMSIERLMKIIKIKF